MTSYLRALLPGVAASALFWLLDRTMLNLSAPARTVGMVAAFLALTFLSLAVLRRGDRRRSIASRRRIGGNLDQTMGDVTIAGGDDVELLSGDRVKGDARVKIRKLDLR